VTAVLNSGELKGKKIGNTWRITRAAVDEFLKS
jgi:excisionase family DNA binding protein